MRLEGKVAMIAGGAGAIGSAQARLFAAEGAAVAVADINLDSAIAVANGIESDGGQALTVTLDVAKAGHWAAAVEATVKAFGRLDILCNTAGANRRVSFDEQTEEMWRFIMDINLTGPFLGIRAVVPAMRRAGGGSIINIGSLASLRPGGGSPAYGASKTGIIGLTRSAALSYAGDQIRCNVVCPGHVDTPFIRANAAHSPNDWSTSIDNPDNYQRRLDRTPLGRLQTPEDIAKAFLFLASDESSMVTGAVLSVDGGSVL